MMNYLPSHPGLIFSICAASNALRLAKQSSSWHWPADNEDLPSCTRLGASSFSEIWWELMPLTCRLPEITDMLRHTFVMGESGESPRKGGLATRAATSLACEAHAGDSAPSRGEKPPAQMMSYYYIWMSFWLCKLVSPPAALAKKWTPGLFFKSWCPGPLVRYRWIWHPQAWVAYYRLGCCYVLLWSE